MTDGVVAAARAYYRSLDDRDYDALADLLADEFVHDRPDLTLDGRERFVAFMREERPQRDTTHRVDAVFAERESVAAQGRLFAADGTEITGFVDVFSFDDDEIRRIETYTD